jgi:hypothetical protein
MATSIIATIMGILVAASSKVLADELKAWRPYLVKKLIGFAVSRLREKQRERYNEEWSSYVEEMPGEIGRVLAAIGLVVAAVRIGHISRLESLRRPYDGARGGRGRNAPLTIRLLRLLQTYDKHWKSVFLFGAGCQGVVATQILSRCHWSVHHFIQDKSFSLFALSFLTFVICYVGRYWIARRRRKAEAELYKSVFAGLLGIAKSAITLTCEFEVLFPAVSRRDSETQALIRDVPRK